MSPALANLFRRPWTEPLVEREFEATGVELRAEAHRAFGRSLAIREVDSGSDNATEIELVNLTAPHYDVERFGVSFVASPRHADVLLITGAVTHNMAMAVRKTYEAMPHPKFVVAVGDDACHGGLLRDSYAVRGGAGEVLPVDLRIPGNPPEPLDILRGLLSLMREIRRRGDGARRR